MTGEHSMTSRNRGKKKPNLRRLSLDHPTDEEHDAVWATVGNAPHPIVIAILGCAMVEHQLDILLRRHFRRNDDDTWEVMVSDKGPLDTMFRKITAAYAFGIIDPETQHNINVVRGIRNTFAHAKK